MNQCTIDPQKPWRCQNAKLTETVDIPLKYLCFQYDMCLNSSWRKEFPCTYRDFKGILRTSNVYVWWREHGQGIYREWEEDPSTKETVEKSIEEAIARLKEKIPKNTGRAWSETSQFKKSSWIYCGPSAGGGMTFRTSVKQCPIVTDASLTLNCKTDDYFEVKNVNIIATRPNIQGLPPQQWPDQPPFETIPPFESCYHVKNLPRCGSEFVDEYNKYEPVEVILESCACSKSKCRAAAESGGGECKLGVQKGYDKKNKKPWPRRDINTTVTATVSIDYQYCK